VDIAFEKETHAVGLAISQVKPSEFLNQNSPARQKIHQLVQKHYLCPGSAGNAPNFKFSVGY
jgi:hypothetical protein